MIGFYSSSGDFRKADVGVFPFELKTPPDREMLERAFQGFGIRILEVVDNAIGIEVLQEDFIDDCLLFVAISIDRMSVLKHQSGAYMPATRGYLLFHAGNKLVILCNQRPTLPGELHKPLRHVDLLKQDLLRFKESFECGIATSKGPAEDVVASGQG